MGSRIYSAYDKCTHENLLEFLEVRSHFGTLTLTGGEVLKLILRKQDEAVPLAVTQKVADSCDGSNAHMGFGNN
jgi:hypothetical protein